MWPWRTRPDTRITAGDAWRAAAHNQTSQHSQPDSAGASKEEKREEREKTKRGRQKDAETRAHVDYSTATRTCRAAPRARERWPPCARSLPPPRRRAPRTRSCGAASLGAGAPRCSRSAPRSRRSGAAAWSRRTSTPLRARPLPQQPPPVDPSSAPAQRGACAWVLWGVSLIVCGVSFSRARKPT